MTFRQDVSSESSDDDDGERIMWHERRRKIKEGLQNLAQAPTANQSPSDDVKTVVSTDVSPSSASAAEKPATAHQTTETVVKPKTPAMQLLSHDNEPENPRDVTPTASKAEIQTVKPEHKEPNQKKPSIDSTVHVEDEEQQKLKQDELKRKEEQAQRVADAKFV